MRLVVGLMAAILLFGCMQQAEGGGQPYYDGRTNPQAGKAGDGGVETGGGGRATVQEGGIAPTPVQNTTGVLMADYTPPGIPHFDFSEKADADGRPIAYYFHSSGCSACAALQPEIDRLREGYPEVAWRDYDLATVNGSYAYRDYAAQLNLSPEEMLVPQVLVNGTIITDRFRINATLEGVLRNLTSS